MTPQRKQQHRRRAIPCLAGVASIALAGMSCAANAQQKGPVYPDRPVRMLVGFAPGGGADTAARPVGQRLSEVLGQQFVVDNRPGAGGNIATEIAARATPDGYSLLVGTIAALAINPSIYEKLAFDPIRDFSPITNMASSINVLVVHPSVAAKTVKELVALLRAKPGSLNYGSSGIGATQHMSAELFAMMTGTQIVHVPYKGGAPAMADLLGGQIDFMFDTAPSSVPMVKAGKVRGLAVTSRERSKVFPELPTMDESGLKGYELRGWIGLLAPAATPREVVLRINAEVHKMLSGDLRARLFELGLDVAGGSPESFGAFIKADIARYASIVKAARIPPQ